MHEKSKLTTETTGKMHKMVCRDKLLKGRGINSRDQSYLVSIKQV